MKIQYHSECKESLFKELPTGTVFTVDGHYFYMKVNAIPASNCVNLITHTLSMCAEDTRVTIYSDATLVLNP